jgi:hypothetical protein
MLPKSWKVGNSQRVEHYLPSSGIAGAAGLVGRAALACENNKSDSCTTACAAQIASYVPAVSAVAAAFAAELAGIVPLVGSERAAVLQNVEELRENLSQSLYHRICLDILHDRGSRRQIEQSKQTSMMDLA